jgi:hypothetical protein
MKQHITSSPALHTPRTKHVDAIKPGPCTCTCAGCDQNIWHCFRTDTGCGWTRTAPKPKRDRRLFCAERQLPSGVRSRTPDRYRDVVSSL